MDRRTAISRISIMLGGTLSASTLSALISGCSAPEEVGYTPRVLSEGQFARMGRIADAIIPDTDTPGARAAGIHRFIDTLLAEYLPSDEAEGFRSRFGRWSADFDADTLTDRELSEVLSEIDKEWAAGKQDDVWASIKEWTVAGYYTSEIGMTQELRLMPYTTARMDIARSEVERTWAE